MNDGGTAFPCSIEHRDITGELRCEPFHSAGMSLRDWFAGQALTGEIATWSISSRDPADHADKIASRMYRIADAMLAAREQRKAQEGREG